MRYRVTQLQDGSGKWVILDQALYGYCTLPDHLGNLWPLEWNNRHAAEAWMRQCYRMWAGGHVLAPKGWQPPMPGGVL